MILMWNGNMVKKKLNEFLEHLNGISYDIKLTIKLEDNNCTPFLDVSNTGNEDGTLGHQVFKKWHILIVTDMWTPTIT